MKQQIQLSFTKIIRQSIVPFVLLIGTSCPALSDEVSDFGVTNNKPLNSPAKPIATETMPFTMNEFWDTMRSTLNEQSSDVIRHRVEDLFDFHLGRSSLIGNHDKYGHFEIVIMRQVIALHWDAKTFGNSNIGECVALDLATKDVLKTGWKSLEKIRSAGGKLDRYEKNGSQLNIYLSDQCVVGFEMFNQ
ncbi:hypothetical protein ACO0K7_19460 [Undibacterium sp. Ji67W]|uniref:hypothetical protein n=1 Tax=Undibacterium sp. Ji67W TaxID=3413042 RepID=UPI003BEF70E7